MLYSITELLKAQAGGCSVAEGHSPSLCPQFHPLRGLLQRASGRVFFCLAAVHTELNLDKLHQHRYYVSVSQQNIGFKSAKRRFPFGAWFFVALFRTVRLL